jgi:hypothetical protein
MDSETSIFVPEVAQNDSTFRTNIINPAVSRGMKLISNSLDFRRLF